MPEFVFRSGEGLVLDERAGHPVSHLFAALTPAVGGEVIVVNFTSADEDTRESWRELILQEGDHPFIRKPTCIPFAAARVARHEKLCRFGNESGTITYSQMEFQLHTRILTQLMNSNSTPNDVKQFVTLNFGPEMFKILAACVVNPRLPPSTDASPPSPEVSQ